MDFYTVIEGASRRGETAFGYRDATPAGAGDGQAAIHVNPKKTEKNVFEQGDLIIVLAED